MPIQAQAPDGSIHEFPDGTPDAVVDRVMKGVISKQNTFKSKAVEYNAAIDKGDNATASKLYDELNALNPEYMADRKKQQGPDFLRGVDNILAGKADMSKFLPGAVKGLESAGRGVAGIGGQAGEDILVNAPIAAIATIADVANGKFDPAERFSQARQQGEQLAKEHGAERFIGEMAGYAAGASGLKAAGITGAAKQGAVLGAAHSLGEGKILDPMGLVVDTGVGAVAGKAGELLGNAVAKPIAVIGEKVARNTGALVDKVLGRESDSVLRKQAQDVVNRLKMSAADLDAMQKNAIAQRGKPLSVAELADEDTVRTFARLANERDTVGRVAAQAENDALIARPGEMRDAISATGPTMTQNAAMQAEQAAGNAALQATKSEAVAASKGVADATDELLAKAASGNQDALEAMRRSHAAEITDLKEVQALARREVKNRLVEKADIRKWGNKAMRDTGLADELVTVKGDQINAAVATQNGLDLMVTAIGGLKDSTALKGRIAGALKNASEGGYFQLPIGDADILRKLLITEGKKNGGREFLDMAEKLRGLAGEQVPAYEQFLGKYAGASSAAAALKEADAAFGRAPDVVRMGYKMAESAGEIARTMGNDGVKLMDSLNKSLNRLGEITAEIKSAKNLYSDAVRATKDSASEAAKVAKAKAAADIEAIQAKAAAEASKIKELFLRNKQAVSAAKKIMTETTDEFKAVTARAGEGAPLAEVARGSIANKAGQSPAQALSTAKALADGAVTDRVASVAGQKTADTLKELGRVEVKAATNLNRIVPKEAEEKALSSSLNGALDVLGGMSGRMGPGYKASLTKKAIAGLKNMGMSASRSEKMAEAMFTRDIETFNRILKQAYTSDKSRAIVSEGIRSLIQALLVN